MSSSISVYNANVAGLRFKVHCNHLFSNFTVELSSSDINFDLSGLIKLPVDSVTNGVDSLPEVDERTQ